jgi:hypothetical protein
VKFELSKGDYQLLLLALGMATGLASRENRALMNDLFRFANTINKDNPDWTPYEVPAR